MNILLVAINAKYIHSNLAVYNLRAYANQYKKKENQRESVIELAEYTINQSFQEILTDLYLRKPDFLAFSCYIWNIEFVKEIIVEIHKLYPQVPIWLGGPEASYCGVELLENWPQLSGVMVGEGEETFTELVDYYTSEKKDDKALDGVQGIVYRNEKDEAQVTEGRKIMDLSKVPFVYDEVGEFDHKIIYYESSRGCPFSCSYCLSSIDKNLRFRDIEIVKKEIKKFLEHKVKQVKFVDRTFNCNHKHTMEIWKFMKEHDNGITNFHFEVAADLLTAEEIQLLSTMRKGFVQLEIGVQSTFRDTILEIKRVMDFEKVSEVVRKIQAGGNIHQHLDLIVGLPHETYVGFQNSFNEVYALHPEQLQLGFLKVLKGSYMYQQRETYGLVYQSKPPYEIMYNQWVSYDEVLELKAVEEMLEVYYNSGQFVHTMEWLERLFETPFAMYREMSQYYQRQGYGEKKHTRLARYEILYDMMQGKVKGNPEMEAQLYDTLMLDLYLREPAKVRPHFARPYEIEKQLVRNFFEKEEQLHQVLKGYEGYDKRQMSKMTHVEILEGKHMLFDYRNREVLTHSAAFDSIEEVL